MASKAAPATIELDVDGANSLAQIITFVRRARSVARPEISVSTGLSRGLATKYIDIAIELNLLRNGEVGQSSGGRAPRMVNFNSSAGSILVAELGATGFSVALSDLYGNLLSTSYTPADISKGPEEVLLLVEDSFDELIASFKIRNLWGIVYLPFVFLNAPEQMPSLSVLGSVLALGLFPTAMAFILFFQLIKDIGTARGSLVTYLNTAFAVILGVIILREPFTLGIALGLPLVLIGSYFASRKTVTSDQ